MRDFSSQSVEGNVRTATRTKHSNPAWTALFIRKDLRRPHATTLQAVREPQCRRAAIFVLMLDAAVLYGGEQPTH